MKREMIAAVVAAVVGFGVGVWVGLSWDREAWFLIGPLMVTKDPGPFWRPGLGLPVPKEYMGLDRPLWRWQQWSVHGNQGDCDRARRELATQLESQPDEQSKAYARVIRCVPTQVLGGARGR